MDITHALISEISTLQHLIAGIAFFVFAAFEIPAALMPKLKIPAIGSFILFCAGVAGLLLVFDKTGGTPDNLLLAMSKESIFFLFLGLDVLIAVAGLIGIMQYLSKGMPSFWKIFQMLLFCIIAFVFYTYPRFYGSNAIPVMAQIHRVICYAIICGAAVSAINVFIKIKIIAFVSVFIFFVGGALLVQFKEAPESFGNSHVFRSSMPASPGEVHFEELDKEVKHKK